MNLGGANGHPRCAMSNYFTNQTLAQSDLWPNKAKDKKTVYHLSVRLFYVFVC